MITSIAPSFREEMVSNFSFVGTSLEISPTLMSNGINLFEKLLKCCLDNKVVGTNTRL